MTATRKIILACLAAMFVASLAAYPLGMVGMDVDRRAKLTPFEG